MKKLQFQAPLTREIFMRDYWQQKPALLRQALPLGIFTLEADELAGLACEEDVESRLIQQHSDTEWSLQHGPLDEDDFTQLPDKYWTLLVQDVEKHIFELADLFDAFDFIPDWRIDDIMVSYATDQGGVGPHTDNYDVFLIQAQGQRHWRISEHTYTDADLLDDCPIRVLKQFTTNQEWLLNPGDILYLPPGIAHWGIAQGECMTWSLGLRGANQWELAQAWLSQQAEQQTTQYFQDSASSSNQITNKDTKLAQQLIQQALKIHNEDAFKCWFSAFVTEAKTQFDIPVPDGQYDPQSLYQYIQQGAQLTRHPWARLAQTHLSTGEVLLCLQGDCLSLDQQTQDLVHLISHKRTLQSGDLLGYPANHAIWPLLCKLCNKGWYIGE